jgi:excisionase family DNA binding protein
MLQDVSMASMQQALMTATEVAAMLGTSSSTVRRRTESGELPSAQKLPGPNGNFLYDRAVVEKYRDDQAEQAKAATA